MNEPQNKQDTDPIAALYREELSLQQPAEESIERWSSGAFLREHTRREASQLAPQQPKTWRKGAWFAVTACAFALLFLVRNQILPRQNGPSKGNTTHRTSTLGSGHHKAKKPTPLYPHRACRKSPPTMRYAEKEYPSSLNPLFADNMAAARITDLLFDRLVGWHKNFTPAPALAKRWKIAKDKRSITFELRNDVFWHDGRPFTATDVIFTIRHMPRKSRLLLQIPLHRVIKSLRATSPHRLHISFHRPMHQMLRWFHIPIIPRHRFLRKNGTTVAPKYNDTFALHPIGTGPYRFVDIHRFFSQKIVFKRVKHHWRRACYRPNRIELRVVPNNHRSFAMLANNTLDLIGQSQGIVQKAERHKDIMLYPYSRNEFTLLGLNHRRLFRDKRVREAFALAIDRQALMKHKTSGFQGQIISGPFSPNEPGYNFHISPRRQNLSKARKYLDKSGWKRVGHARRKGKVWLTPKLIAPAHMRWLAPQLRLLKKQLKQVGVQLRVIWLSNESWHRQLASRKGFDMTLHSWHAHDNATRLPLFHSQGQHNYMGFRDPKTDQLLMKLQRAYGTARTAQWNKKLHARLHEQIACIYLWSATQYASFKRHIKRVTIHPMAFFHFMGQWHPRRRRK